MKRLATRPIIFILILTALAGYFFFLHLGSFALTDPDETFYAQTAKEMYERDEWITPYLYGKPQFEKPALFYWLVHASYNIFGVSEFSARLPSAVFGLVGVIVMYLLGSLLFNRRTGVFSAVILATCIEYIILSRACVTDMVLTVFMLLGVYLFFLGYRTEKKLPYILSAVAFGFAVLTKGPVFIALAVGVFAVFLFFARDLGRLKKMPILWGVLAYLAITVPWYLIVYKLHGSNFVDEFFGFHNVTRFLVAEHKIGSQIYYNIPIILGGFFPWSVFLPLGLWRLFVRAREKDPSRTGERQASIFTLVWFFVIFLFFTASSTKLPTYVFPAFIALALTVGALWDEFLSAAGAAGRTEAFRISFYLLIALSFVGVIAGVIYTIVDYPAITMGVAVLSALMCMGMALACAAFARGRYILSFGFIVYAVGIILIPLDAFILPEIERYETSKTIACKLKGYMKEGERLGCEDSFREGLSFYTFDHTGQYPIDIGRHHDLITFLRSPDRVWCVLKEKNHRFLYEGGPDQKPLEVPTYMLYKIGKRAIVTNRMPDDGVYLVKRERGRPQ